MRKIILASASPRRREILQNLGLTFDVVVADVDETSDERDPSSLCELLAARKGNATVEKLRASGADLTDTLVIASDTVVAAMSGGAIEILGKPRDGEDAARMLALLSGRTHRVMSGIWLWMNGVSAVSHDVTEVVFDPLAPDAIERYIATKEPFGKAGAYAIQGYASSFIAGIQGDYFNVVGLPVHRMCSLFRTAFPKEGELIGVDRDRKGEHPSAEG